MKPGIGKRVKAWREAKGLTQREAALGAGISQPAWHALESGALKRIGLDVADRIVAYMDGAITLDDLRRPSRPTRRASGRSMPRTGTDG